MALWHPSVSLRSGVGYKDNVTLSSGQAQGSAFEQTGLDFMVFRLPWNNWQFSLFASGNDTRYFDPAVGVDTEQNAAASAQLTWFLGRDWKSLTSLQYSYLNQVIDVSATTQSQTRAQVLGHGITGREALRKDLGPYWIETGISVSRYYFRLPLDNYWQGGPQMTLGRGYGHGSEVSLSYQPQGVFYDTREQTALDGSLIADAPLRFLIHSLEAQWQHVWDKAGHWRNVTRLNLDLNRDNGPGFYDYVEYRLNEQFRYRTEKWELTAQASAARYEFERRAISSSDPAKRNRTSVTLGLRGEWKFAAHWKAFASYNHEHSLANFEFDEYAANIGLAGIELSF